MPKHIDGKTYYRTTEACEMAGISKGTLFRWLRVGIIPDTKYKDRNGWRLFTKGEIDKIKALANKTIS